MRNVAAVFGDTLTDIKRVLQTACGALQDLAGGRLMNGGKVTLTASATTTVITRRGVGADDVCLLQPRTANAAAALATTYTVCTKDTITITHANNAQVDKTFGYVFFSGPTR